MFLAILFWSCFAIGDGGNGEKRKSNCTAYIHKLHDGFRIQLTLDTVKDEEARALYHELLKNGVCECSISRAKEE